MSRPRLFYGWKLLLLMWLSLIINLAFPMYGGSVMNAYMASALHLDRSTLGLAFGVFTWMSGLPGPLVAWCVNKKGVRFTLVLGSLFNFAGALLMATLVRTPVQIIVTYGILVGLATLTGGPIPTQSGMARWFVKKKALAISLLLTGSTLGGFIAPTFFNHVITAAGGNWRLGWWIVGGLSLLVALMAGALVKERPSDLGLLPDGDARDAGGNESGPSRKRSSSPIFRTTEEWTFAQTLHTRAFWQAMFAVVGYSAGLSIFVGHGIVHLKDLGHSPAEAAFSFSLVMFFALIGKLLMAALGDRIEPRLLWAAALTSFGIGMALAFKAGGGAGLYLYAIFLGTGLGAAFAAMMTLPGNYFGAKAYPSIVGVITAIGTTAGAVGAYGAGYAFDNFGSYARAFYAVSILCFAGAANLLILRPPVRAAVVRAKAIVAEVQ